MAQEFIVGRRLAFPLRAQRVQPAKQEEHNRKRTSPSTSLGHRKASRISRTDLRIKRARHRSPRRSEAPVKDELPIRRPGCGGCLVFVVRPCLRQAFGGAGARAAVDEAAQGCPSRTRDRPDGRTANALPLRMDDEQRQVFRVRRLLKPQPDAPTKYVATTRSARGQRHRQPEKAPQGVLCTRNAAFRLRDM